MKLQHITTLAIIAALTACSEPERVERAVADESGGETDADLDVDLDQDEVVASAMDYEASLVRLSDGPETSETHADAASVYVWGSADAADLYNSINPDDPTQAIAFPRGTTFVKEHFDEAGDLAGVTIMYKGPEGYDPEHGDWFWARVRGIEVTHAGRVDWCSDCHDAAHNSDFVVGFGKSG